MSWRIIVVSSIAKLDLKLNHLVIRKNDITKVHLSEIAILVIENTAVSITAALISELAERKIKVIFCDQKRNPQSELISYYGSHDTSAKCRSQILWSKSIKLDIWTEIVTEKIFKQMELLRANSKKEAEMLKTYLSEIVLGDKTNREGHAAKVYFNALFGKEFTRSEDSPTNAALNYGYGIILSAFNREIVINGYLTQLGLFHNNTFNFFNLSSDLMEPFRIMVDRKVFEMTPLKFEKNEKLLLVDVLNENVQIEGKNQHLINAIRIYVKSIFNAIEENDISLIRFYDYEF
jgi:CRISPR-associated endonuclease Cas1 subtype II